MIPKYEDKLFTLFGYIQILLALSITLITLSSFLIPAAKSDCTVKNKQYELLKENDVYAVHGTERVMLYLKKKITVRYIESPGVEKEKDLYEWDIKRIKTGKPRLEVITYKKRWLLWWP